MRASEEPDVELTGSSQPKPGVYPYLSGLNPAQHKAVTADPAVPLQILAGPGSGKTRVLTSRVAYLVQHHKLFPHQITAVTFTNKAANEMRKRLEKLLGPKLAGGLVLGTFHATCVRFLRRYGGLVDIPNNFAIADADDCKKIVAGLIKARAEHLEGANISLKDRAVLSDISKAKSRGETADAMAIRAMNEPSASTSTTAVIAEIYGEYEASLRESNSLDFDDLLVYGLKLFTGSPGILASCHHILVDEFQDTNVIQYELMKCFAKAHQGVTIVGDPDQSVYGWRSAEVENLNRMKKDFTGVKAIYLEQNYRSTGSILSAASTLITQDRDRPPKSLYTSHPKSTTVNLKTFSTPVIEASFIATEIKRMIAYSGDVLNHGDFAILLRYNALSRVIESALQKDGIPNRIVGGHKFFDRLEVKDLLAYLQLAENPNFTPAFIRVVNTPKRAIGDKSVADLVAAAKRAKISPMELCERMTDGDPLPEGIKAGLKNKLASFVGIVRKLRRAAQKGSSVADLLKMVVDKTDYENYLKTTQQDAEMRLENVKELISFSVTIAEEQQRQANADQDNPSFVPASSAAMEAYVMSQVKEEKPDLAVRPLFRRRSSSVSTSVAAGSKAAGKGKTAAKGKGKKGKMREEDIFEVLSSDEEAEKGKAAKKREATRNRADSELSGEESKEGTAANLNPLSYFLQTSMLSTDTENQNQEDQASVPKVTISTVHAAKGLEWPVVFIPAVESGTFPFYRCVEPAEVAEERRLLYVAMTRAQLFLTMSHCQFRMAGGDEKDRSVSEFIALAQKTAPTHFSADLPDIEESGRKTISSMLERPVPDESGMKDKIMKHVRAAPPLSTWDAPEARDSSFNRFARREVTKATRAAEYWNSEADEYALPGQKGFASALHASNAQRDRTGGGGSDRDRMLQPNNIVRSPKPPPVLLPSRNHQFPEMPKFSFNVDKDDGRGKDAGLGSFTNASTSSLAMMKNLGLPGGSGSGGSSPMGAGGSGATSPALGSSARFPGLGSAVGGGFQASAAAGLAGMKGLGMPDLPGAAGGGGEVLLAKGKKRLGMGRPQPWGAKKTRND
ncbi:P-loop containing nucleoside triphosphate hydrolase protein [Dioszegia hungarica]|uniref:DNA 3'-5' helicase n=1 Tax=Dioszegia hungarica TaxID=4972 RepID=A0AA38LPZ8_9TREE|nr:P-loop containing nucleoside triphosphate hydrolase protein [Dioszegia hungarica]KAI9632622.1 P-loop containing nucleoside triphosphate hydrolase protein [Dioszegia hungarica]